MQVFLVRLFDFYGAAEGEGIKVMVLSSSICRSVMLCTQQYLQICPFVVFYNCYKEDKKHDLYKLKTTCHLLDLFSTWYMRYTGRGRMIRRKRKIKKSRQNTKGDEKRHKSQLCSLISFYIYFFILVMCLAAPCILLQFCT